MTKYEFDIKGSENRAKKMIGLMKSASKKSKEFKDMIPEFQKLLEEAEETKKLWERESKKSAENKTDIDKIKEEIDNILQSEKKEADYLRKVEKVDLKIYENRKEAWNKINELQRDFRDNYDDDLDKYIKKIDGILELVKKEIKEDNLKKQLSDKISRLAEKEQRFIEICNMVLSQSDAGNEKDIRDMMMASTVRLEEIGKETEKIEQEIKDGGKQVKDLNEAILGLLKSAKEAIKKDRDTIGALNHAINESKELNAQVTKLEQDIMQLDERIRKLYVYKHDNYIDSLKKMHNMLKDRKQ